MQILFYLFGVRDWIQFTKIYNTVPESRLYAFREKNINSSILEGTCKFHDYEYKFIDPDFLHSHK